MLAQSTSEQPAPYIVGSSYLTQDNSLACALYSNRYFNDQLLKDIFAIAVKNSQLACHIQRIRGKCPQFMTKWWESTSGVEAMTTFLKDAEQTFAKEIDAMTDSITEGKRNSESAGEEYDYELEELEVLKTKRNELQRELDGLIQRNNAQEEELNYLYSERRNFRSAYKEQKNNKQVLALMISNDMVNLAKFTGEDWKDNHRDYEEAARKYQQQEKSFLLFLFERRHKLMEGNAKLQSELDKIDFLIQKFQAESKGIQLRKESIVSKHVELKRLKEELALREQQRKEAAKKKRDLEKLYCEEEMESLAHDHHEIQVRIDHLVGKTLQLAKQSIEKTKLNPLQRILDRSHEE